MSSVQTILQPSTQETYEKIASLNLTGSPAPLKLGNALDQFAKTDSTPTIGTEFVRGVQLAQWLKAPNADELIRDLAILVSQRGVVFFREQDLTLEEQKQLGQKLGELSGKPESSKLHLHPTTEEGAERGDDVTVISSERNRLIAARREEGRRQSASAWHTDITFEPVPSDYAILKIHALPTVNGHVTGGDTLWASAYEAYDRLSPSFAKYIETLQAYHHADFVKGYAEATGKKPRTSERGSPGNVGDTYESVHPVVRTNPVTGWKNIYVNPGHTKRIVGVTKDESDFILKYLFDVVRLNHDLQVRFKWEKDSLAIWDNRSVFHAATPDYGLEKREGNRVVSLGEKPYFDPTSKSRREALGLKD